MLLLISLFIRNSAVSESNSYIRINRRGDIVNLIGTTKDFVESTKCKTLFHDQIYSYLYFILVVYSIKMNWTISSSCLCVYHVKRLCLKRFLFLIFCLNIFTDISHSFHKEKNERDQSWNFFLMQCTVKRKRKDILLKQKKCYPHDKNHEELLFLCIWYIKKWTHCTHR